MLDQGVLAMRRVLVWLSVVCWSVVSWRCVVADESVRVPVATTESTSEAVDATATKPEASDNTKDERNQPIAQKDSSLPVIEPIDSKTAAEFVAQERLKEAPEREPRRGPSGADHGPRDRNNNRRPEESGTRDRDDHRPSRSEHRHNEHGIHSGPQHGPGSFGPRSFGDPRPPTGSHRRPSFRQPDFGRGQPFGHRGLGGGRRGFGPQFGHRGPRGGFAARPFGPHRFGSGSFGQRGFGHPFMPVRGHEAHRPQFHRSQGNPSIRTAPIGNGASLERMFETLDRNKDGVISKDEFLHRPAPSEAHRSEGQRPESGLGPSGRQESGRPSFGPPGPDRPSSERSNFARPGFGGSAAGGTSFGPPRFDNSGRGPGMSGPPSVEMIFERLDRNHDGKVSKDEAPSFFWERLSTADTNKDGSISKEEMERHQQRMRDSHKPEGRDNRPADERPKTPSA